MQPLPLSEKRVRRFDKPGGSGCTDRRFMGACIFDMTRARLFLFAMSLLLTVAALTGDAAGEGRAVPQSAHTHRWRYQISGDTITAHCDEDCPLTEGLALRVSAPNDLTYDGQEKPITLKGDVNSEAFGDDISIAYVDDKSNRLITAPVNAGAYVAVIELPTGFRAGFSYSISKAPLALPAALPMPINSPYDGKDHALVAAPEHLPEGCIGIRYSVDGDWSEDIPTGIEAGDYPIEVEYLGDENHADYIPAAPVIASIEPSPSGIVLASMTTRGADALNVFWTQAKYVDGYDVFLKKCSDKGRYQLVATVEGQGNAETTVTGLKPNTNYKGGVWAWVMKNGEKQYVLDKSPVVHVITGGICKGVVNPSSLKLNHANVTLRLGRRVRLNGTVKSTLKGRLLKHVPRLRFVSSDPSVASVDKKGDVTALKEGSCEVYVLTNNGIWKSVSVTVDPSPESIWFDHADRYVAVGKQLDLGARLRLWPGKSETSLTWSSSNETVATVTEKGVVKGLKKGKTTITVVASNEKSTRIRINVK